MFSPLNISKNLKHPHEFKFDKFLILSEIAIKLRYIVIKKVGLKKFPSRSDVLQ